MTEFRLESEPTYALVSIREGFGIPTTTSRQVAEHFEKEHKSVLREIRSLLMQIPVGRGRCDFVPTSYIDSQD